MPSTSDCSRLRTDHSKSKKQYRREEGGIHKKHPKFDDAHHKSLRSGSFDETNKLGGLIDQNSSNYGSRQQSSAIGVKRRATNNGGFGQHQDPHPKEEQMNQEAFSNSQLQQQQNQIYDSSANGEDLFTPGKMVGNDIGGKNNSNFGTGHALAAATDFSNNGSTTTTNVLVAHDDNETHPINNNIFIQPCAAENDPTDKYVAAILDSDTVFVKDETRTSMLTTTTNATSKIATAEVSSNEDSYTQNHKNQHDDGVGFDCFGDKSSEKCYKEIRKNDGNNGNDDKTPQFPSLHIPTNSTDNESTSIDDDSLVASNHIDGGALTDDVIVDDRDEVIAAGHTLNTTNCLENGSTASTNVLVAILEDDNNETHPINNNIFSQPCVNDVDANSIIADIPFAPNSDIVVLEDKSGEPFIPKTITSMLTTAEAVESGGTESNAEIISTDGAKKNNEKESQDDGNEPVEEPAPPADDDEQNDEERNFDNGESAGGNFDVNGINSSGDDFADEDGGPPPPQFEEISKESEEAANRRRRRIWTLMGSALGAGVLAAIIIGSVLCWRKHHHLSIGSV